MTIKKTSQYIEGGASLSNVYGTSNENGYTQEYINGLETYSTDEVRVGTWIDGKPIYRKHVKIQNPSAISGSGLQTQNFPHGISNLKRCVNIINPVFGNTAVSYNNRYFNFPILGSSGHMTAIYEVNNTNIILRSYSESWTTEWFLECTLEYTKTTD